SRPVNHRSKSFEARPHKRQGVVGLKYAGRVLVVDPPRVSPARIDGEQAIPNGDVDAFNTLRVLYGQLDSEAAIRNSIGPSPFREVRVERQPGVSAQEIDSNDRRAIPLRRLQAGNRYRNRFVERWGEFGILREYERRKQCRDQSKQCERPGGTIR